MAEARAASQTGWAIAPGFAAQAPPAQSSSFYALYDGADFGAPARGLAGVIARAHAAPGLAGGAARDAAQLAVYSFAEGYFGARRTLSPRRAAAGALSAFNRWLAAQMPGDGLRPPVPVSLSGVLFCRRRVVLVQIGACQVLRQRAGVLTPLIRPHLRLGVGAEPSRALGLEDDLALAFAEEDAAPGDVLLLLAGGAGPNTAYAALAPLAAAPFAGPQPLAACALAMLPGPGKAVMALQVEAVPEADAQEAGAELAGLPIRPEPRPGDVWDDFTIGRSLFRGRYTVLRAATDGQTGRDVALKIPLKSMLQDEVFAAGFMREAWIGATLHSACVARYLDIPARRRTALYLVLPLYEGETLEARLNRAVKVSLPEGLGIALKLCEAVQDLAGIEVIHRDIKPDNVMLLGRGAVKLLDLGLAFLPGIDAADALKPGGTIRYMAPELLLGQPASARSEVYALAVTIYRMFSGGPYPFGQHETLPLAKWRPDLPRWLGEVLARALAAKPEDRFADAGALARALQAGLAEGQQPPLPARPAWVSALRLWQGAAILFAGLALMLALR